MIQHQWQQFGNFLVFGSLSQQAGNIFVKKGGCDFCIVLHVVKSSFSPLTLLDNADVADIQKEYRTLYLQTKSSPAVAGIKRDGSFQTVAQYLVEKHYGKNGDEINHHLWGNKLDNRMLNLISLYCLAHGAFHGLCKSQSTPEQIVEKVLQSGYQILIDLYGTIEKAKRFQQADIETYRERIKLEFFQNEAEYTAFIRDIKPLICD